MLINFFAVLLLFHFFNSIVSGSAMVRLKRRTQREMHWTHAEMLDDYGDIVLRWQPRHQEIAFRVEARTNGYLAVGFSSTDGLKGADIVVGWIDDKTGQPFLLDCHAVEERPETSPVRDEIENYKLMNGFQNETHTVLEFRRALDTCDPEDFVLNSDTVRVIWALHNSDPEDFWQLAQNDIKKGEQSLYLLSPPVATYLESTRSWETTLKNFRISNDTDTVYWCKIFKAPTLNNKHHIVGWEPIIGRHHSLHMHHMLLHECDLSATVGNFLQWEKYVNEEGAPCYSNDMPELWESCLTPTIAWAIGSKGESLPHHVGLPLADKSVSPYYMLEVHFDNPLLQTATDTSGLRIHYTHQLRRHDAGMMVSGITISPLHVIPPQQPEYKTVGYCSSDCTKQVFPNDGIKIVSVLLHSHSTGKKINLRHIRDGKELKPIVEDNRYDFNYQKSRYLSQEVTVLSDDILLTECTYSTLKRNKLTVGGYSTSQEMCLAFILHYPRTQLIGCYSMPPVKYFFETFGVREFYDKKMEDIQAMFIRTGSETVNSNTSKAEHNATTFSNSEIELEMRRKNEEHELLTQARYYTSEGEGDSAGGPLDQLIIKEPLEFRNKSFISHLNELPWGESLLTKRIEESFYFGQHLTFCRKRSDFLVIPQRIEVLPRYSRYMENATKTQCNYQLQYNAATIKISSALLIVFDILVVIFKNYIKN